MICGNALASARSGVWLCEGERLSRCAFSNSVGTSEWVKELGVCLAIHRTASQLDVANHRPSLAGLERIVSALRRCSDARDVARARLRHHRDVFVLNSATTESTVLKYAEIKS